MENAVKRAVGWLWVVLAATLAAGASVHLAAAAGPTTQVAVVAPVSDAPDKAAAAQLRAQGVQAALEGRFEEGLNKLRRSAKADPADPITKEAVELLEAHMKTWARSGEERADEYRRAIDRVASARIAQAYADKADANELRKCREGVDKVIDAYNGSATAETLEDAADADEAARLKDRSVRKLAEGRSALAAAMASLPDKPGPFVPLLRRLGEAVKAALGDYAQAWKDIPAGAPAKLGEPVRKLREAEYRLTDALGDLESMTIAKPWQAALAQARLAARLADAAAKDALTKQAWFRELVSETEKRGETFARDGNWQDAFHVWASLKELTDDEERYGDKLHVASRHVRALRMYGPRPTTAAASRPAAADGNDEDGPPWREAVANVDADMVEKVIRQLDRSYVSAIDYRKLTCGALVSIQVLAEAPQVRETFAGLKDDKHRGMFLKAVAALIDSVQKRDRPDHVDLIIAMNSVLAASERTVNIPTEVLCVEFTDGFLDELDKFSSMIWPSEVADFEKQTMGHFCGVGIQISKELGQPLKVVTPLLDTPAYRMGIKSGDLIIKVDGKSTEKLSIDKLVKMIMGEKGTKVVLTVKRAGRVQDYAVARDRIDIRTVRGWSREPATGRWDYFVDPKARVGYIRLTQFTERSAEDMQEALRKVQEAGARCVVLDLRFNPGGLLRSATDVANEFLLNGRIVSTRGRRTRPTEVNADPKGLFLDGDLVVLVNEYSASAAEIVSGALKDWSRARVVGQRTYGKGSVQNVIPVRRDSALLKLTTAYYYLPKGRLLHRQNGAKEWGVDPDVEVLLTPRQTRRWLDIRRKTDIVQEVDPASLTEDLRRQYDADTQLETAVLLLKLMKLQQRARSA